MAEDFNSLIDDAVRKSKSKRERLQVIADEVGRLMGMTLKVTGSAQTMMVIEVRDDGTNAYPFGRVPKTAKEVASGLRFAGMALRQAQAQAKTANDETVRIRLGGGRA